MDVAVRASAPLAMAGWLLYKAFRDRQVLHMDGALVLVTGASSGIGRELALLLTARGADVIVVARTEKALCEIEAQVNARGWGGRIYAYPCDCSDGTQVEALVERVRGIGGSRTDDVVPDVVINAAGAGRFLLLDEATVEEVKTGYDAPVLAAANLYRAFIEDMRLKGGGAFVNVQSAGAVTSFGGATAYLSARWALRGLTLALQADLKGTSIKVQEVMLPVVESGYWKNNPDSRQRLPWITGLLGIPKITSRRAAVFVARAIETRASFSAFGGTLPLMTALNMLCPGVISQLVSLTASSYSRLIRSRWGETYFATRPPRRPTPITSSRPSLLPAPAGGTPSSPRERRATPRSSTAAAKAVGSARMASASVGVDRAAGGGGEPFQLFPTQLPVPDRPAEVDPVRLSSEQQTAAYKKPGRLLAGAHATPLVGLPARDAGFGVESQSAAARDSDSPLQSKSGQQDMPDEASVIPDHDAEHQAAASVSAAAMANNIAVGRDQLRLLEQRLAEKTREVAKLRVAAAEGGAYANSSKLTTVVAAQGALQRLLDDARGRHEELKQEFDRLHTSPAVPADIVLPTASEAPPGDGEGNESLTAGGLGIMLSQEHNGIQIVVIEGGSPAAQSNGLFRGDVLRAVDDVATRGKSEQEVLDMLKGPPGKKVTLRVKASGPGTPIREVVLVRGGGAADSVRRRQSSAAAGPI